MELATGGKKEVRGVDVSGMLIGVCTAVAAGVVEIGEKVAFAGVPYGSEVRLSVAVSFSTTFAELKRSFVGLG